MKRNLELIKKLLEHIEDRHNGVTLMHVKDISIESFTAEQIVYHTRILAWAGFIVHRDGFTENTGPVQTNDGKVIPFSGSFCVHPEAIISLTWQGHEFLDNAREPKVWNAAMKHAGHLSWGVFTSVLCEAACERAKLLITSLASGLS